MLLAPSFAEPLMTSRTRARATPRQSIPPCSIEAGVFAREQRLDKKWRNLFERNLQPIRTRQSAVDFAVDVENRVAFRHRAEAFQIEGLRPDRIEGENRDRDGERKTRREINARIQRQPRRRRFLLGALLVLRGAGAREKFHR